MYPSNQPQPGQPAPGWYPPGQYPPMPYPPQGPAPSNKKGLIAALVSVALVVIVAVVVVVVWAPWKKSGSDGPETKTFELPYAVTIDIKPPSGWQAREQTDGGDTLVLMTPADDPRSWTQLIAAIRSFERGDSAEAVHVIYIDSLHCAASATGHWEVDPIEKLTQGGSVSIGRIMRQRVGGSDCVKAAGWDVDAQQPDSKATDLVVAMSKDDTITGRQDSSRPSETGW